MSDSPQHNQALQSSGFPFQTAVANRMSSVQHWSTIETEYPWKLDGDESFIDLVAECRGRRYLVVECKKAEKQSWTFLRPLGLSNTGDQITRFRCVYSERAEDRQMKGWCQDWDISPSSIESAYCVIAGSKGGKERILERDAALVLRGATEFALDKQAGMRPQQHPDGPSDDLAFYVPVIVTTAKVLSARYPPGAVHSATGMLDLTRAEVRPERWVRFRKAFGAGPLSLGEQSVFVVAAESLEEFLEGFSVRTKDPVSLVGRVPVITREGRASFLRVKGYS